jgi:hypothetical protein
MQSQAAGHFSYKQIAQHQASLVPRSSHPSSHKTLGCGRYPVTHDMFSVCLTIWVAITIERSRALLRPARQNHPKQNHAGGSTASNLMDCATPTIFRERQRHD